MAAWAQPSALFEDGGGRRELLPLFFLPYQSHHCGDKSTCLDISNIKSSSLKENTPQRINRVDTKTL